MRFTKHIRNSIKEKYVLHTFGAQYDAIGLEEGKLAREVYNTIYSKTDRETMLSLPKGWLQEEDKIWCNAGGYSMHLNFIKSPLVKTPYYGGMWSNCIAYYERDSIRVPYDTRNNRQNLNRNDHADLINRIQRHADTGKIMIENRNKFVSKMHSFLQPITTDVRFKELMPEWESILGTDFFGCVPKPITALTTTAAEIMCAVAQGRGEKRDGCCDGNVIAL